MAPLLSLEGVRKSYRRGRHEIVVLTDVSLDVRAGDLMAIWGQRRAGKTTLARVAAGLAAPDRGTVFFEGRDLAAAMRERSSHLHQEIACVQCLGSQDIHYLTVLDYVALPLLVKKRSRRDARRRATLMLERLDLMDCAEERWDYLTDGQRALVDIANALVLEPKLLVVDDLTVNFDLLQRDEVMTQLRQAADEEGLGILITVSDMPEMRFANQIAVLSHGELVVPSEPLDDRGNVIEFPVRRQSA